MALLLAGAFPALGQDDEPTGEDAVLNASRSAGAGAPKAAVVTESPRMLQQGAWSHSVLLDIPVGPAGLSPGIGLAADHNARGVVGHGWRLTGISRIERRGPTGGAPTMGDDDTFWLDGMRLHPVEEQRLQQLEESPRPGLIDTGVRPLAEQPRAPLRDALPEARTRREAGTQREAGVRRETGLRTETGLRRSTPSGLAEVEPVVPGRGPVEAGPALTFRLEIDDNRMFTFYEGSGEWLVRRDGWRWRFGAYSQGRISQAAAATEYRSAAGGCRGGLVVPGRNPVAWNLSQVEDPSGNAVSYRYQRLCGCNLASVTPHVPGREEELEGQLGCAHLLDGASWAGGHLDLQLSYEARPDVRVRASGGRLRKDSQRLSALEVTAGGELYSRYELAYLDESRAACPGESATPDAWPLISTLRRIHQVGSDGQRRTLRCLSVDASPTAFDDGTYLAVEIPYIAKGDAGVIQAMPVNFDGDEHTDLALLAAHCPPPSLGGVQTPELDQPPLQKESANSVGLPPPPQTPSSSPNQLCAVTYVGYSNRGDGTGTLDYDLELTSMLTGALGPMFAEQSRVDGFLTGDLDGDGATELIVAEGYVCEDEGICGVVHEWDGWSDRFRTLESWVELDGWEAVQGRLVDIDGDRFPDLVLPAYSGRRETEWIRNRGAPPYLHRDDIEPLRLPWERNDNPAAAELETMTEECEALDTSSPFQIDTDHYHTRPVDQVGYDDEWRSTGLADYSSDEEYWASQTRFADFNGDGITDLAAAFETCWHETWSNSKPILVPEGRVFSRLYYGDGRGNFHDSGLSAGPPFLRPNSEVVGNFIDPDADPDDLPLFNGWSTFTITDLDLDGVPEAVQQPWDGATYLDVFPHTGFGHDAGFGFDANADGAWRLPGSIHALDAQRPFRQDTVIADWDSDGFPDILVLTRDPDWSTGEISYTDSAVLYRNQRSTAAGRLTDIVNPFGGTISIDYAASSEVGDNPNLPMPLRLVAGLDDDRGETRFLFHGGAYEDRQFRGFAEVVSSYDSGLEVTHRFATSRELAGARVSTTERRRDGTLERYQVNSFSGVQTLDPGFSISPPPWFRPVRRSCEFVLGPGAPSHDGVVQSLSELELMLECLTWQPQQMGPGGLSPGEIDPKFELDRLAEGTLERLGWKQDAGREWSASFGDGLGGRLAGDSVRPLGAEPDRRPNRRRTVRQPTPERRSPERRPLDRRTPDSGTPDRRAPDRRGTTLEGLEAGLEAKLDRRPIPHTIGPRGTRRPIAHWQPMTGESLWLSRLDALHGLPWLQGLAAGDGFPLSPGPRPDGLIVPSAPPVPFVEGEPETERGFWITDFEYDDDQRLARQIDYREADVRNDNLTVEHTYGAWLAHEGGKQLVARERFNSNGVSLGRRSHSDFAAFGLPGKITESRLGESRSTTLTYDRGMTATVERTVDGERLLSTTEYDDCGRPVRRVDPAGRFETLDNDLCRQEARRFEGGEIRVESRDGWGRPLHVVRDDGVSPPLGRWLHYDDAFDRDPLTEPHSAVVEAGLAMVRYADEWGRGFRTVTCPAPSNPGSASLASLTCDDGIESWQGWAADGSLRWATAPFYPGETPAAGWQWTDERGRVQIASDPAPIYLGDRDPATPAPDRVEEQSPRYLRTTLRYFPQRTEMEGPSGLVCEQTRTSLRADLECAGSYRAGERFNALGLLTEEIGADGVSTRQTYDAFWRVESEWLEAEIETCGGTVTDPRWTYTWDDVDRLTEGSDPDGNVRRWSYDAASRPLSATYQPAGEAEVTTETWAYTDGAPAGTPEAPAGRSVEETDVHGNITARWLDGFDRVYSVLDAAGYRSWETLDADGRLASVTDVDGLTVHHEYDELGRLAERYLPKGPILRIGESFAYDGAGRIVESTDADGVTTTFGWTWDGQPAWEESGGWTLGARTYRDDGPIDWEWSGGVETTFEHDDLLRTVRQCLGWQESDGSCGLDLAYSWSDDDLPLTESVGGLPPTSYRYDALGRLVEIENPDGTSQAWTYGVTTDVCEARDEEGIATTWTYDGWGRTLTETRPGRAPRRNEYAFGVPGRLAAGPDAPAGRRLLNGLTAVEQPDGGRWTLEHDYLGRPVSGERPDGTRLRWHYTGRRIDRIESFGPDDAAGSATPLAVEAFGYDPSTGRLAWQQGPVTPEALVPAGPFGGTPPDPADCDPADPEPGCLWAYHYEYTDGGRLSRFAGPNAETLFTWDDGLLQQEEIVGVTRYTYDYDTDFPRLAGYSVRSDNPLDPVRTVTRNRERGLWIASELAVTAGLGGGDSTEHRFSAFDPHGTPLEVRSLEGGETVAVYTAATDDRGRMTTTEIEIEGEPLGTVTREYYGNDAVHKVWTSFAGGVEYDHSPATFDLERVGLLDDAGSRRQPAAKITSRDAMGRATAFELAGGAEIRRRFDTVGRMTALAVRTAGGDSDRRSYRFDARGRLQRLERLTRRGGEQEEEVRAYEYREPGWLVREVRDPGEAGETVTEYRYDAAGNRLGRAIDGVVSDVYRYAPGNKLIEVGTLAGGRPIGQEVEWDGFGGVIRDHRGWQLGRDPFGRVVEIEHPEGPTLSITRDAFGAPVAVHDGEGGVRRHVWGNPGGAYPLASLDDDGTARLYVAAEGMLLGVAVDGALEPAATDAGGSLVMLGGELVDPANPWGEGAEDDPAGLGERFVWAALERLPDTPYLSAEQRLYDPELGRFASLDPIGLSGGPNRFVYANNDPLGWFDPHGTFGQSLDVDAEGNMTLEEQSVDGWSTSATELAGDGDNIADVTTMEAPPVEVTGSLSAEEMAEVEAQIAAEEQSTTTQTEGAEPADSGSNAVESPQFTDVEVQVPDGVTVTDPISETINALADQIQLPDGSVPANAEPMYTQDLAMLSAQLENGYSFDSDGLLRTPGGNIVIPGVNDQQNPSPLKAMVNSAAGTADFVLNGGFNGMLLQAAGVWEGNGTPAAGLVESTGWGYTGVEKGRAALAEASMDIAMGGVGGIGRGLAGAGARGTASLVARAGNGLRRSGKLGCGCSGPLGRLPDGVRKFVGIKCFESGTPVMTPDGLVPIEEISAGDMVLGWNEAADEIGWHRVTDTVTTEGRRLVDLVLAGADGREESFGVTPGHLLFVEDLGWVEAGDLHAGDRLRTAGLEDAGYRPVTVVSVTERAERATTHNLEVSGAHTFFVGETGLLAHNGWGETMTPTQWADPSWDVAAQGMADPGQRFLGTDALGRPKGVMARITPDMLRTGERLTGMKWYHPTGAYFYDRGHLLAKLLGGVDLELNNVPLHRYMNRGPMQQIEGALAAVVQHGNRPINLAVRPQYSGIGLDPTAIRMSATDGYGWSLHVELRNSPRGGFLVRYFNPCD